MKVSFPSDRGGAHDHENRGRGDSDRVLGVHILGDDAGEMAQLLAISLRLGAKKADFDATMALHPSAAEELVTLRTRTARHMRAKAQGIASMCGRFAITSPPEAVRAFFRYAEHPNFPPRYNIAPTQPIPLVSARREGADAARHFQLARWGFLPGFVKDPAKFPLIINARAETLRGKAEFSRRPAPSPLPDSRRCWYEWRANLRGPQNALSAASRAAAGSWASPACGRLSSTRRAARSTPPASSPPWPMARPPRSTTACRRSSSLKISTPGSIPTRPFRRRSAFCARRPTTPSNFSPSALKSIARPMTLPERSDAGPLNARERPRRL